MGIKNTIFHGVISKCLWRNEKTASAVVLLRTTETIFDKRYFYAREGKSFYIRCTFFDIMYPNLMPGMPVIVEGRYKNRTSKDEQYYSFDVQKIRIEEKRTKDMESFFQQRFSMPDSSEQKRRDTLERLLSLDDPIYNVSGFAPRKGKLYNGLLGMDIVPWFKKPVVETTLCEMTAKSGITYPQICRLFNAAGVDAIDLMTENPYKFCYQNEIGFSVSDKIAKNIGYSNKEVREKFAVKEILRLRTQTGSTLLSRILFNKAYERLTGWEFRNIKDFPDIIPVGDNLGNRDYVSKELSIATEIKRLFVHGVSLPFKEDFITEVEKECGVRYGRQQRAAIGNVLSNTGLKVISGGPGTGKTTLTNGIIRIYKKIMPKGRIILTAPTGRAAQRMTEQTGMPACTTQMLVLKHRCKEGGKIPADFIILDETSMLDTDLFQTVLCAAASGSIILLLGDVNQLEAVGHGKILQDLLDAPRYVGVSRLTEVFRQKGGSPIVENSIRINNGNVNLEKDKSFDVFYKDSEEETMQGAIDIFVSHYKMADPFSTQILVPAKDGLAGVKNLNAKIQSIVNPFKEGEPCVTYGDRKYHKGDKIIMTRNNYEYGYYNGDVGIVKKISGGKICVSIRGEAMEIGSDCMDDIDLAYAMTIHKSQGSEFANAIVVLPKNPGQMLLRNLVYTGVTRGKKNVWIVSEGKSLEKSIQTSKKGERETTLSRCLRTV